jgi:hypothetical protein
MNKSVWTTLRPRPLTSFIALVRIIVFATAALIYTGAAAQAQLGTNPVGTNVTLGPSDSYNGGPSDGYDNYGNVTVDGAEFNQDVGYGLLNEGSDNIESGEFDSSYIGVYDYHAAAIDTISGGNFDSNTYGLLDDSSTDNISGGEFDNNFYGLYTSGTTAPVGVTGGNFNNNTFGLYTIDGSVVTVSTGDFQGNTGVDLVANGGTIDIYGESFGGLAFGDLSSGGSAGSFDWTLSNGTSENLTYYNAGTIDLIYAPPAAAPAPEGSSVAVFAGLALGFGALVLCARRKREATE